MARIIRALLCTLFLCGIQNIYGVPVKPSVNDDDFDVFDNVAPQYCKSEDIRVSNLTLSLDEVGVDPGVTCLNLENNRIENVAAHAFKGNVKLKHLSLANNPFPLGVMLRNLSLPKLQTLNLDCSDTICNLSRPTGPAILRLQCQLPELKELYMRHRRLFKITSTQFNIFPKLTHLYLSNNFIHRNPFIWLPSSLEYLNLRNNELTTLFFRNLPKLMYLSVSRNRISRIEKTSLVHVNWLMNLDLSFNEIEFIENGSFDAMRSLRNLNLEGNKLKEIPILKSNLTSLFLNDNNLRRIETADFNGLRRLKALYLNDNKIYHVGENAFHNLKNLEVLVLRGNSITKLPANWVLPMSVLQHLDLGNNEFKSMCNLSLQKTSSNVTLHLQNNRHLSTDWKLFDDLDNGVKVILDSYRRPQVENNF